MFCKKCGNPLPENAKYCDKCGISIKNASESTSAGPESAASRVASKPSAKKHSKKIFIIALMKILPFIPFIIIPFLSNNYLTQHSPDWIGNWIGYDAELENGNRVKRVTYIPYDDSYSEGYVEYDVEGNVGSIEGTWRYHPLFNPILYDGFPLCPTVETYGQDGLSYEPIEDGENTESLRRYIWQTDSNTVSRKFGDRIKSYTYNKAGYVTTSSIKNLDSGREEHYEYIYDGPQQKLSKMKCDGDIEVIITYNEKEQLATITTPYGKTYYDYDTAGRLASQKIYKFHDSDDASSTDSVTEYNIFGLPVTYSLIGTTEYEYDENGNCIKESPLDGTYNTYEYVDGQKICTKHYKNIGARAYLFYEEQYRYSDAGYLIDTRKISYKYEANKDSSVVNLIETSDSLWIEESRINGKWEITYYTNSEIEKYWHDKEFEQVYK